MNSDAPQFDTWQEDFFEAYYHRRPVNATFIGVHAYDNRLPDFSENGAGDTLAEMHALLRRLAELPEEQLSISQRIDRQLAAGFLEIQAWEYQSEHFQRGNPCTYTGEAIFGLISLFLTDFAPLAERLESAIARMNDIPAFLAQGQANVRQAPLAWTERAIRECDGALAFLQDGLVELIQQEAIQDPHLRPAADLAAQAFATFRAYLQDELSASPEQPVACGEAAFDMLMRKGHCLDMSPEDILAYAEHELIAAQHYLEEHAGDFAAASPEFALAQLAELHPTLENYYGRYTELWQAARQTAETHQLLTWPDFPIDYVPQPRWARKAAPYLYFLFYRAPAAFNRPDRHAYLVTPIEAEMPPEEQLKLLQANNDSVIKLNHVVHHGSIGHHVQNWNAYQASSRIGQVAAVDTAARIAMFCGGTMAEGWAVYATGLMDETGFLSPLESYSEIQSRRRMSARAIVDVRLHHGHYDLKDAARFYQQQAGMSSSAAMNEAVKNSMFPGAAMIYLMGSDLIRQLRQELAARLGNRFDLRQFHDRLLSYGSIPVPLIAREIRKDPLYAK